MRPRTAHAARLLASAAVAVVLALSAAGCTTTGSDTTGSIAATDTPRSDAEWRRSLDVWSARYHENPEHGDRPGLCPRFTGYRSARPGGRRARAGFDPQSAQHA